ncbi:hypothetical protein G6F57_015580 [Rhizopus arrhizus]|nr:hypothetical protein G6F57_015580 [Rhizopus arrhizus]
MVQQGVEVDALLEQRDGDADQHQHRPHRRGEVMADADQHVGAADPVQAAAAHHLAVLQVALAPAAVTHQQGGQRRRAFLVAAAQVRHHVRGPAATAHQRGFHEIVAEHVAAERLAPRQRRQAGVVGEGAGADDRVVAPVVALGAVPPGHATGDHRAVHAAAELLHAGEQGAATDHRRQRLDQADIGVVLHACDQAHDAVAGHQAVGVEDQHLRIGTAKAAHPVGDVAGLAPTVVATAAIEQPRLAVRHTVAQFGEHLLFGTRDVLAAGIAEHEEIEALKLAGGGHRFIDGLQARQQAARIFVVGRHQQRGAAVHGRQRLVRVDAEPVATVEHGGQEARQCAGEGQRDPGKQAHEQHQQAGFKHADAIGRQHPPHHPRRSGAATCDAGGP